MFVTHVPQQSCTGGGNTHLHTNTRVNTHSHPEEILQRDIDQVRKKVMEMASLAERALQSSVQALVTRNRRIAYSVILRDQYIGELETELDRLCLEFVIRLQPVAGHLRFVFATIQINRELERIGGYAESIARQVLTLSMLDPQPPYSRFIELAELCVGMLQEALRSYLERDAALATHTIALEERAHGLRNSVMAELKELSDKFLLPQDALVPLSTVARDLERAAGQVKNLCEDVLYMCTGQFAKYKQVDTFRILFVDLHNGCLSQMAEAIGRSLAHPHFAFCSAGLKPRAMDARWVEFMARKALEMSQHRSKSLEEIPEWECCQVIVALAKSTLEQLPACPTKPVYFTWLLEDPGETDLMSEAAEQAFESAYQRLKRNIADLVGAILELLRSEERA